MLNFNNAFQCTATAKNTNDHVNYTPKTAPAVIIESGLIKFKLPIKASA